MEKETVNCSGSNRQSGMADGNPVFKSLALIEERLREKLTVKELADSVHFSKYHYQRMFREAVGDSVMGYVARRRISLAARELAETDAAILEIALRYGYDSHEGFTRSFRSYMGITPSEYRKYHLATGSIRVKEESSMIDSKWMDSKATDEIIREMNGLIVQAKETAAYTRKSAEANAGAVAFYSRFWETVADKTDCLADRLTQNLNRVTSISRRPDEISARFLIMRDLEEAAFQFGITAFQAGLTIARARPEYREVFMPVCGRYEDLARSAGARTGRIMEFMQELWGLILQEMRKDAECRLQLAVEKGMEAARCLSEDSALPYRYIACEVQAIAEELSAMSLEDVTAAYLEDDLFRLDMIAFASDMDALRVPGHKPLLEGIGIFRDAVSGAAEFFRSLPVGESCASEAMAHISTDASSEASRTDSGAGFWGKTLLFYLRGEVEKLGKEYLNGEQRNAFAQICDRWDAAVRRLGQEEGNGTNDSMEILRRICQELTALAEELGIYGAAIQYIAGEMNRIFAFM